jgi:hypothetical protein
MNTIAVLENNEKRVSLVIDLDGPTQDVGRSVVAQTVIACDSGAASIRHSFTYAELHGDGALVKSQEHLPPIAVEKPSEGFLSAVRTVCEAGPWWNTPADLYAN